MTKSMQKTKQIPSKEGRFRPNQNFSDERFAADPTEGVKENVHSGIVQACVTADDLFAPPAT